MLTPPRPRVPGTGGRRLKPAATSARSKAGKTGRRRAGKASRPGGRSHNYRRGWLGEPSLPSESHQRVVTEREPPYLRRQLEEVGEDLFTAFGEDGFGVELDTPDGVMF